MLRREFLSSVASLLFSGSLNLKKEQKVAHPFYGEYVSHSISRIVGNKHELLPKRGPYHRYVIFPDEVILKVIFKKEQFWTYEFVNFNCPQNLQNIIAKLPSKELIEKIAVSRHNCPYTVNFFDEIFRLSSVSCHEEP